jgi:hypothetical protein
MVAVEVVAEEPSLLVVQIILLPHCLLLPAVEVDMAPMVLTAWMDYPVLQEAHPVMQVVAQMEMEEAHISSILPEVVEVVDF